MSTIKTNMDGSLHVVILAAGLGTRMRSKKAKVLHEAGGMALIEHVVDAALQVTSAEQICVVVGHQAEAVKERLAPYGVQFALQPQQLGTGHALLCCANQVQERAGQLLVLYGDTPLLTSSTLQRLLVSHRQQQAATTLITTSLADPTGYGRIVRSAEGTIAEIVEQKAATPEQAAIQEINSGIYCFESALLWAHLPSLAPNPASGEIYLTDLVARFHSQGQRVLPFSITDASELLGINTRVELAMVDALLRHRKTNELMLAGVTIRKPETVSVDMRVSVGQDTVIEAFTQLLGTTQIGEECHIGAGSIVQDSTLSDRVTVLPYTLINSSRVGEQAHVGPFARLRLQNDVGANAHIGNFVELKKTRFGEGSKAMHLSYLGDAIIGERVNVGAGTITCNYDGVNKNPTEIGDDAFIGSNSTLIAPLEVGKDSYVGAGSVITDAVPEGSLALGRERQIVKQGWARKRKQQSTATRKELLPT